MQLTYVFLILSVITYMFGWVAVLADGSKNRNLSKTDNKLAIFFIILIFITIFIAFGFRHVSASSIDEYAYRRRITTYKSMSFGQALTYGVEWLAIIPTWILSNLTQNTQWILIFTVFVTYALLIIFIKQNSDNFELGVLMIFLINFANYSLNAVQQCEATAILAFGLPYIQKKEFKKYLVIVLLASLVHTSAIIMLAVYFIANMKPWSGKMIGISFLFIVLMFSFTTIMPRVFSALNMYENYIDFLSAGGGVKTITVIVAFIPPVLAFVLKERLPKDDREFNCLINIVLVYALIYMVSFAQRYVARFAIYLLPWVIIFYTKLITHLRKERLSALVYYVLVVGYGVTMIYFTRKMEYAFMVRGPAGW